MDYRYDSVTTIRNDYEHVLQIYLKTRVLVITIFYLSTKLCII